MGTEPAMNPGTAIQDDPRTVRLSIPARAEYITLGRLALTGIAHLHELSDEIVGDLKLALTEACTNSVRHAYEDGEGAVEIVYELQPGRLTVDVRDEGPGFTPPDHELGGEGAELSEGGLGIAIIRALTDEFELMDGTGGGSHLRFVKYLEN
jgi:serine/threonine-protein kinase RsbW